MKTIKNFKFAIIIIDRESCLPVDSFISSSSIATAESAMKQNIIDNPESLDYYEYRLAMIDNDGDVIKYLFKIEFDGTAIREIAINF